MTLNINTFNELTYNELMLINGGEWNWYAFFDAVVGGAVSGAIAGSAVGTMTIPLIGEVPGVIGGAVIGAIGGALKYTIHPS
ncbi:Blp family class II bacteriocin [Tepidibacter thalassicus]|uniref:Class IIb bacteriocin, lactobin A/cerein 7B family n=1 Tax=Tepidibacter thalassicus DSM 15285 TaxID=1123350 RepID=A0A1M5QU07_9FIRM|nr:Blp family class II bacteriocin [Tepidibacter thalassicus]SHH17627.1 class IIb bacteriocin, lactobin A/cerein 7B family [Tepidibacter thalassicus DSM 15285]